MKDNIQRKCIKRSIEMAYKKKKDSGIKYPKEITASHQDSNKNDNNIHLQIKQGFH